jgi:hypothetical protein
VTAIPFALSSMPGFKPQDSIGRLINVYGFKQGGIDRWRSTPGLRTFCDLARSDCRGLLEVNTVIYAVYGDKAITITAGGVVTVLTGTVGGSGPVTMARNRKAPTPDIVICDGTAAYEATASAVNSYSDPDVGSPNSVCFLDGYFLFTYGDGTIRASDLNDVSMDALSFASAEAKPDGLSRGVAKGGEFFAMGPASVETSQNAGESPYPLTRSDVISVGLAGPWAVAGHEDGWEHPLIWVASDSTVRRLAGHAPELISFAYLERLINAVEDKTTLRACVYTFGGQAFWILSSDTWTWAFNQSTGFWHEVTSYGLTRWRGVATILANNRWYVGDSQTETLLYVDELWRYEVAEPISSLMESAAMAQLPARFVITRGDFMVNAGVGLENGDDPTQTTPRIGFSVSRDGGSTFGPPEMREIGREGQYDKPVSVFRKGLATRYGCRWRVEWSDPVDITFRGGDMTVEPRAA